MRVLLVEDDPDARTLMEIVLSERGHDVAAHGDGESAWTACQRERFPLMLLDWMLPGMDGLALCRRVRSLPEGDESVVVVITARGQTGDLAEVLEAGADDYLSKPFPLEALDVRLAIAERRVEAARLRRLAALAQAETARLQGVLLASSTVEHNLGNQLALTMGYAELLANDPRLDPALRPWAEHAVQGVVNAVATLEKIRRIRRIEQANIRGGSPVLDLELSAEEPGLVG